MKRCAPTGPTMRWRGSATIRRWRPRAVDHADAGVAQTVDVAPDAELLGTGLGEEYLLAATVDSCIAETGLDGPPLTIPAVVCVAVRGDRTASLSTR